MDARCSKCLPFGNNSGPCQCSANHVLSISPSCLHHFRGPLSNHRVNRPGVHCLFYASAILGLGARGYPQGEEKYGEEGTLRGKQRGQEVDVFPKMSCLEKIEGINKQDVHMEGE